MRTTILALNMGLVALAGCGVADGLGRGGGPGGHAAARGRRGAARGQRVGHRDQPADLGDADRPADDARRDRGGSATRRDDRVRRIIAAARRAGVAEADITIGETEDVRHVHDDGRTRTWMAAEEAIADDDAAIERDFLQRLPCPPSRRSC